MALIKAKEGSELRTARTVSVNSIPDFSKTYAKYDGKTLVEVDVMESGKLLDITVGQKEWEGGTITNLVLKFKDRNVAFPLSRGFAEDVEANPEALLDGEFYLRKKMKDGDVEGEPTGDPYMSFGKPSGLTFDTEKSLVAEVTA